MGWRIEWKAISDRIQGLSAAGQLFLRFWASKSSDPYGVIKKELIPQAIGIFEAITQFHELHQKSLSPQATSCINRFIGNNKSLFFAENPGDFPRLQAILTKILSFQSEFTYQISDTSAANKRLAERAFIHLNRSIVADHEIRAKWKRSFESGETSCEKLGAAHLLLHGIWAFKASAAGERTDLVLGASLRDISQVQETAETLVLTEWKVVRDHSKELAKKIDQALYQAKRYSSGILAGFELAAYRYLVMVSRAIIKEMPQDLQEGEITYRLVNIAVDPLPPSKG